jgi:hypothetical protein
MNRRLIGIVAGVSVLGLGVPAFAAARGGDGTPEDNGVPGDVRGNCDEAEHAADAECLGDPTTTTVVVDTLPATTEATTTTTVVVDTIPATTEAEPEDTTPDEGTVDDEDEPEDSLPGTTVPGSTPVTTVEDVRGNCDEAEHADDPRCTGAPRVDNSGPGNMNDDNDAVDNSGPGNANDDNADDDHSGRRGGDDNADVDDNDDDNGGNDD